MRNFRNMAQQGLYDPRMEHDACGIGFVAQLSGVQEHGILTMALTAVGNMSHRGGVNADGKSGDGAGVLTQIPREFFARELSGLGVEHDVEKLAVGMFFLPQDEAQRELAQRLVEWNISRYGMTLLHWREVHTDEYALGTQACNSCPCIMQALIVQQAGAHFSANGYERALFLARKAIEAEARASHIEGFSVPSLSSRTIVYKGLMVSPLLPQFYPDLRDPLYKTAFAMYHQRYSTNTAPSWERAQPFHMLSHNGEINTLGGNITWMRAREAAWRGEVNRYADEGGEGYTSFAEPLDGSALASQVARLGHVVDETGSDSAMLDNVLELLVLGGRDVRQALSMLVPEAWEKVEDLPQERRDYHRYQSTLMEPWDGPAALAFSDGQVVGLALDRNGLRPARYALTDYGLVVCGSEAGIVPLDEERIIRKGKLGPGQMIVADLLKGQFQEDEEIKRELCARRPYGEWLAGEMRTIDGAGSPALETPHRRSDNLLSLQRAFGYTSEELTAIIRPMLQDGVEPIGSMGDDTSAAVFSAHARPLYNYFKQRFAEVTNPPIDPLREELVMSLAVTLGRRGDLMEEKPGHARLLRLDSPVLTDQQLRQIRSLDGTEFASETLQALFQAEAGAAGLGSTLQQLAQEAESAVRAGKTILIISDRGVDSQNAPVPALLALGAVHRHLIKVGLRTRASLVVESGEPREVHHLACLVGLGAEAVNPYLALATAREMAVEREEVRSKKQAEEAPEEPVSVEELAATAEINYVHALEKGLLKIMSKMGIAAVTSYCGAQIFEAIGLDSGLIERYFTGVPARLGGIGLEKLAADTLSRHTAAFNEQASSTSTSALPHPGFYKYKKEGEYHSFSPPVVHALQKAVTGEGGYAAYRAYSDLVHNRPPSELRDLLEFVPGVLGGPAPIEEVEPVESIVQRFSTAAMSHGSTSIEAHETLAVAMNRLGGLSNSGEGGEDPERYANERNSTIKQVASARFGVTPGYLVSARELQIKMAQGSKPGEGGQIPAHKVSEEIARIRHTPPGISLVSPPPHHDIYSIEDLAQLIYDLKQVNPQANVSVKLVAEAGVGTVAAGVVKGGADVVLISGNAGGTGASPLSSIKNAGINWELGLAETQQTLVLNGLRGRVRLRVDGGLKTGRDVVMSAMLGADEFSFGTTALVAEGCLMARTCHSNNCPVGIATQRPELRAKFKGTPEMVIHFFMHLAQEVRELLAQMGARTLDDVIGRTDLLRQTSGNDEQTGYLDLAPLLQMVGEPGADIRSRHAEKQSKVGCLNGRLVDEAMPAVKHGQAVTLNYWINNRDRTVGATLSGEIARAGVTWLPEGSVTLLFRGSAGQSFGAFLAPGVRMLLTGEANDYVGKGMAGGEIIVRPCDRASYTWHESAIMGNTVLYGATGGALFAAGRAGERFAVRNSGAIAVVEGVGDHACEYMTGGVVLVLGTTGRNFAAGMTAGTAYVFDEDGRLAARCNKELAETTTLDAQDEQNVYTLLSRHRELTSSRRAEELLRSWEKARLQFRRVQPRGAMTPVLSLSSLQQVVA